MFIDEVKGCLPKLSVTQEQLIEQLSIKPTYYDHRKTYTTIGMDKTVFAYTKDNPTTPAAYKLAGDAEVPDKDDPDGMYVEFDLFGVDYVRYRVRQEDLQDLFIAENVVTFDGIFIAFSAVEDDSVVFPEAGVYIPAEIFDEYQSVGTSDVAWAKIGPLVSELPSDFTYVELYQSINNGELSPSILAEIAKASIDRKICYSYTFVEETSTDARDYLVPVFLSAKVHKSPTAEFQDRVRVDMTGLAFSEKNGIGYVTASETFKDQTLQECVSSGTHVCHTRWIKEEIPDVPDGNKNQVLAHVARRGIQWVEGPTIPTIPDTTKNYVLKSVAGTLTWVEETTKASSST